MMKKIVLVNLAALSAAAILVIISMPFANNAVELGFLTGVSGRKLFAIPFSGGIGVGVVNLVPIAGLLLTIGSAVYALTGIPWANSRMKRRGNEFT
ncbi:hypothetical protein GS531_22890 [Rhodococcus hoagii]|nr:hypothetical protein [Prescottella equi]